MRREMTGRQAEQDVPGLGITGRLISWWQRSTARRAQPSRLTLVERIALGPKQVLSLIEAEGTVLLLATSPDSTPVFFALPVNADREVRATKDRTGSTETMRSPSSVLDVREIALRAVRTARRAGYRASSSRALSRSKR